MMPMMCSVVEHNQGIQGNRAHQGSDCDFDENVDGSVFKMDFSNKTLKTEKYGPFDTKKSGVFYSKGLSARVINQRGYSHYPINPKGAWENCYLNMNL